MADMVEVVIKMPKEKYDSICSMYGTFPAEMKEWGFKYIKNGTVLQEGHGDLVDRDAVQKAYDYSDIDYSMIDALNDASVIIEADTQNKENKEDITPYVTGVTLLSVEEARNLDKEILKADKDWWLRSPGRNGNDAAFVYGYDGDVFDSGDRVTNAFGLRPALEISKSSGYKIGESVDFGGNSFTIISDTYALCDDVMGECPFRHNFKADDANEYETSDIKRYVEYWFEMLKEQNLKEPEEERDI